MYNFNYAPTMKKFIFLDVMPRGSYKNRRFGGTYRLHTVRETLIPVGNDVRPIRLLPFSSPPLHALCPAS
jgi:hypothetical protein